MRGVGVRVAKGEFANPPHSRMSVRSILPRLSRLFADWIYNYPNTMIVQHDGGDCLDSAKKRFHGHLVRIVLYHIRHPLEVVCGVLHYVRYTQRKSIL